MLMRAALFAVAVLATTPAAAQQVDLSKPLAPEQYQNIIVDLCGAAIWANRMRYQDNCEALRQAFAAMKVNSEQKPKGE